MKVAVTGAGGFVGRAMLARLAADGHEVLPIVRTPQNLGGEQIISDLDGNTDWGRRFEGIDAIIHLAARVHVGKDEAADPLVEYRRVNLEGTLNLARSAAEAGVRRFLFMSSIKVNGESTAPGQPFRRSDKPAPSDPYGVSKFEAEQALAEFHGSGMGVVVIRPPLIYGPGVKGNFRDLMRWVEQGRPLPVGSLRDNRRSLVALTNLVDLSMQCLIHPAAADKLYLVSDGRDLSTRTLIELIADALGRKPRLRSVPPRLLAAMASLAGRAEAARRLLDNLQVDMSETRSELEWAPPITVEQELQGMARSSGWDLRAS